MYSEIAKFVVTSKLSQRNVKCQAGRGEAGGESFSSKIGRWAENGQQIAFGGLKGNSAHGMFVHRTWLCREFLVLGSLGHTQP